MPAALRYGLVLALIAAAFGLGYATRPALDGKTRAVAPAEVLVTVARGLPATRSPDELDPPPAAINAPVPLPDAQRPRNRADAQALARKTFAGIARFVQNVETGSVTGPSADVYFLSSHYSGWPGLCAATAMSIDDRPDGGISSVRRYRVVGAFTSPPVFVGRAIAGSAYARWQDRIMANCAARDASSTWFSVDAPDVASGREAWDGAVLIDGVVAASRASGPLPFALRCEQGRELPLTFCDDARRSLATVDPADIASIARRDDDADRSKRRTIVTTNGDPFVTIDIRQARAAVPGATGWAVTNVQIDRQVRPIMN